MSSVADKVLVTVNAPYGTDLTAEQLATKISDVASVANCDTSAFAFYSEVSVELQREFLAEMRVDEVTAIEISRGFSNLAGCCLPMARTDIS